MSKPDFVKGVCRQCGGHLEFPAEAAGSVIDCPHCGKTTELTATAAPPAGKSRLASLWITVAAGMALALAATLLLRHKIAPPAAPPPAPPKPTMPAKASPAAAPEPVAATNPPPQMVTNEFALFPFRLDKLPGSSLVYVTGTLQNLSDRQRFGVKLEFDLFDAGTNGVGKATDYQSMLDPHGEWHFKALVIPSKVVSAQFGSISEEK